MKKSMLPLWNWIIIWMFVFLLNGGNGFAVQIDSVSWCISDTSRYSFHQFSDIKAYNCNGSLFLIASREAEDIQMMLSGGEKNRENKQTDKSNKSDKKKRKKGAIYYLSRSLDDKPKRIYLSASPKSYLIWDAKKPNIIWYLADHDHGTSLYQYDANSEKDSLINTFTGIGGDISPAHISGDYLLFNPAQDADSIGHIYSIKENKITKSFNCHELVHRIRFVNDSLVTVYACNGKINPEHHFLIDSSGQKRTLLRTNMSTPTWTRDGKYLSGMTKKSLSVWDFSGNLVHTFDKLTNHIQNISNDGRYLVADCEKRDEYAGWIVVVDIKKGTYHPIVNYRNPEERTHDSETGASWSPDATKCYFNYIKAGESNLQIRVVKVFDPVSPQQVTLSRSGDYVTLKWDAPKAVEIKSCSLYSRTFDGDWRFIKEIHLPETSYSEKVDKNVASYQLVFTEFSGLPSRPVVVSAQ